MNTKHIILIILVGLGFIFIKNSFFKKTSPTKTVQLFINKINLNEDISSYIVLKDNPVVKDPNLIKYFPIKIDPATEVLSETILSEDSALVEITTSRNKIKLVKENNQWVLDLNLIKHKELYDLSFKINKLSEDKNEEGLLIELQNLQSMTEESQILVLNNLLFLENDSLDKYIEKLSHQVELKKYTPFVEVVYLKKSKDVLFLNILNKGNRNLSQVRVKLSWGDQELEVEIFRVLEGNVVYGKPIPPNSKKLVGLDINGININLKDLKIEVTDFTL